MTGIAAMPPTVSQKLDLTANFPFKDIFAPVSPSVILVIRLCDYNVNDNTKDAPQVGKVWMRDSGTLSSIRFRDGTPQPMAPGLHPPPVGGTDFHRQQSIPEVGFQVDQGQVIHTSKGTQTSDGEPNYYNGQDGGFAKNSPGGADAKSHLSFELREPLGGVIASTPASRIAVIEQLWYANFTSFARNYGGTVKALWGDQESAGIATFLERHLFLNGQFNPMLKEKRCKLQTWRSQGRTSVVKIFSFQVRKLVSKAPSGAVVTTFPALLPDYLGVRLVTGYARSVPPGLPILVRDTYFSVPSIFMTRSAVAPTSNKMEALFAYAGGKGAISFETMSLIATRTPIAIDANDEEQKLSDRPSGPPISIDDDMFVLRGAQRQPLFPSADAFLRL
jgi:hypothetical protein